MQAGWSGWRKVSQVISDKRVAAEVKGKASKRAERQAMFVLEMVALTKIEATELEVTKFKIL